jgi:preprotein translocase subunit SecD
MKKSRTHSLSKVLVLVAVMANGYAFSKSNQPSKSIDVFAGSVDSIERFETGQQSLNFIHEKPVISHSSIELIKADEKSLTLDCKLEKEEVKLLNQLLEKFPEKRLAFVARGRLLFAPKIKTKITGETIQISFKDYAEYQRALEALTLRS